MIFWGNPPLKAFGADIYDRLAVCARNRTTISAKALRRQISRIVVERNVYVEALQHREPDDDAVERLISQGSDMFMTPQEEKKGS